MKKTLLTLVVLASTSAFAQSQAQINLKAYQRAEAQGQKLTKMINEKCKKDEEVKSWDGGSGYTAALYSCVSATTIELQKILKTLK